MKAQRDTPELRRKLANIYREAARLIERKDRAFTCCAVLNAAYGEQWADHYIFDDPYVAAYARLMSVDGASRISGSQFSEAAMDGYGCSQDLRVMALCMAAAITERP